MKNLALSEEYLADHFPSAPVMPGVLMLEALVQAGAWLVRASEDFAHSLVTLKQARGVKYANFVEPGQSLEVTAEVTKQDESTTTLKAQGTVDGKVAVSAKLVLARCNLSESNPDETERDQFIVRQLREAFRLLCPHGAAA